MSNILREYVRETLVHSSSHQNKLSEVRQRVKRRTLLCEVYPPSLLAECMNVTAMAMLMEAPTSIKDMTIQEIIDKIEQLEATQQDREGILEVIEAKEKTVAKLTSLTMKTLKEIESGADRKKRQRLQSLHEALTELQEKIKDTRKDLVDPDIESAELASKAALIAEQFAKVVIKGSRSIMGDMQIAGYDEIFDYANKVMDKLEKIPFMKVFTGMGKEVAEWMSRGAKGLSWLTKKIKGGDKPVTALDDMVDKVAQTPDTKTKTAPFMNLFNIDDEYQAILEDELEIEFIQHFKEKLKGAPQEVMGMTLGELESESNDWNIDRELEDWIPSRGDTKDHTVDIT
jgi:hypothetical protein